METQLAPRARKRSRYSESWVFFDVELDHLQIGSGRVGRPTHRLQELYFSAVRGEEPRYRGWLTPVYG